jgi:hypothetical protein
MWKSWFVATSLSSLGVPAMFIFMGTFLVAAFKALRTSKSTLDDTATLPLSDDGERVVPSLPSSPSNAHAAS